MSNSTPPFAYHVHVHCTMQMISAADYLGADLCLKACTHSLSNLAIDQHSILHVWNILNRLWGCSTLDQTDVKRLDTAVERCLLNTYGNMLSIMGSKDLLLSFCKLPLSIVEAWGKSNKLKVDSENSIVVLLNNWWHSQSEEAQTEKCKKKLSALVRIAFLSHGYLHVLDKFAWFVSPVPDYDISDLKLACTLGVDVHKHSEIYSRLNMTKRSILNKHLKLVWRIPYELMQQAVSSAAGNFINSTERYWQGHRWRLVLRVTAKDDDVIVWVGVQTLAASTLPTGVSVSANVETQGQPFDYKGTQHIYKEGKGLGRAQTFKQQDAMAELQKYFTFDNRLEITAIVTNVH